MTALDFPNSPTLGQVFAPGGAALSYVWDGAAWRIAGGAGSTSGLVAYAQVTAPQGGIVGSAVDIPGMSVTWLADPSRRYQTTIVVHPYSTVDGDDCYALITDAANAAKQGCYFPYISPSTVNSKQVSVVETGLSGSTTRKVRAARSTGTGTVTFDASTSYPMFIMVQDITFNLGGGGGSGAFTGLEAAKPATPAGGTRFFATDTKRDWLYDGTGWIIMAEPVTSFTPTTTGVSLGSGGAQTAQYHRSDGYCDVIYRSVLGTASAGVLSTGPTWATPFPGDPNEAASNGIGAASLYDANGPIWALDPTMIGASLIEPRYRSVSGTTASALGQISNTVPATIQVNDVIMIKLRYRMASRYS